MLGTTAELIKLRPVIDRCKKYSDEIEIWCTAQQYSDLVSLPDVAEYLRSIDTRWLSRGYRRRSITRLWHVPFWALAVLAGFTRQMLCRMTRDKKKTLVVHGDTLTTALGAVLGRLGRFEVVHIEAGLRSGDWRNPFPEELCRRAVGRLANIHFAPHESDARNLEGARGRVIVTNGNTAIDNLPGVAMSPLQRMRGPQVLILLHRSEFLADVEVVRQTLGVLIEAATEARLVLVVDSFSFDSIRDLPEFKKLSAAENLEVMPKLPHRQFLDMLQQVSIVVTDSGGVQVEAAALGIPCIIHRRVSELDDGLSAGGNAALTGLSTETLRLLLKNPPPRTAPVIPATSPSDVIVAALETRGLLA